MAVYTEISIEEVKKWLSQHFELGEVCLFKGIQGGIENSNFFLDIQENEQINHYVLTIFERLNKAQLPYYLEMMSYLAKNHIPVPMPISNRHGEILQEINGKPAAIVSKLVGSSDLSPNQSQCAQVAHMLATLHLVGAAYHLHQENLRSLAWWQTTSIEIQPFLDAEKQILLHNEVIKQTEFFSSTTYHNLPAGLCHCDLFRDNVLFTQDGALSGFFDFYFAGQDKWLFDVAVTVNDWCIDLSTGVFVQAKLDSFLDAYTAVRPFTDAEKIAWPMMLRAAALRFWISRLWDFYIPRAASLLTPHDPSHFERILRERVSANAN